MGMLDGKIAVNPPGRVVLPELPEGLISRPTLVWMLENGAGAHTVEASYLTNGIGWKTDYVLVLSKDDSKIDVSGWVTIDNRSGAGFQDATLKLVAGDVRRVTQAAYQEADSMRMAKVQGLPVNPAKISGQCGRLMCCLRYEVSDADRSERGGREGRGGERG